MSRNVAHPSRVGAKTAAGAYNRPSSATWVAQSDGSSYRPGRPGYFALILALLLPLLSLAADTPATQPAHFETVNVYIDSGDRPLAAWQVELKATQGDVKIVGVEGGDHRDLYRDPPYYDPKALTTGNRIILASYTTADTAPKGKTLVARVHLRIVGDYRLSISPMAAADPTGQPITTTASFAYAPTTNTVKDKE